MKPRTALHILVGLLIAVTLVFFASNLQAGRGSSLSDMVNAQRHTPLLWVVDICAVAIIGGMWWVAAILNHFHSFVDHQATQHLEQLDDMIERTSDLESVNDSYADKIEQLEAELARQFRDLADQVTTLEAAADTRRQVFEIETQRISEHANQLIYSQVDGNTRQVEGMSMALQVQKGDLRRLRNEICDLENELARQLALRLGPVGFIDTRDEEEMPLQAGRTLPDVLVAEPVCGGEQPDRWTHSEATA
jgi:hypothetical protein